MANCSDDVIWDIINKQFCSFKVETPRKEAFCRNEYNITGVCSRITCPLANSQYATVRSIDGKMVICIKTPERQHLPSKWWQQVELSEDYDEALKQIEENLQYWPERLLDRIKQRLTRLFQVKATEERLALQQDERHYVVRSSKVKRREASRERKALVAAKLERAIERELLDRLKTGAYGNQPLNVEESVWNKVMQSIKGTETEKEDLDEQELEQEGENEIEFVEDEEDEEDEDLVDVEDMDKWLDSNSDSANNDNDNSDDSGSDSDADNNTRTKKSKPATKPTDKTPRKRVKATKPSKPSKRPNIEYEIEEERMSNAQLN